MKKSVSIAHVLALSGFYFKSQMFFSSAALLERAKFPSRGLLHRDEQLYIIFVGGGGGALVSESRKSKSRKEQKPLMLNSPSPVSLPPPNRSLWKCKTIYFAALNEEHVATVLNACKASAVTAICGVGSSFYSVFFKFGSVPCRAEEITMLLIVRALQLLKFD